MALPRRRGRAGLGAGTGVGLGVGLGVGNECAVGPAAEAGQLTAAGPLLGRVDGTTPLDELVAEIGDLLVDLHRRHGMQYGSVAWVCEVLVPIGLSLDPSTARDLLAAGALRAAGIVVDADVLSGAGPAGSLEAAAELVAVLAELRARRGGSESAGICDLCLPAG